MPLTSAPGNYRFLPGIEPYSSGVIADPGYEILHVTLQRPLPYVAGFRAIEERLKAAGRGRASLCAVELRSPAPFTRAGFIAFNRGYRALLEEWDLPVGGQNPVARTNVAPQWCPPDEPALYAFSFTLPGGTPDRPSFVVAGGGELRGGPLETAEVVRAGETSPGAMAEKAAYVVRAMSRRLEGLGVGWEDVTITDLYSVQPLDTVLGPAVLDAIGPAAARGLHWYHARPPIEGLEYEMDVRGVRLEETL